jgi:membrane protease subunit (stomatin/prohibitin family)
MAGIEFTDNYEDLSTESGFQFKFFCESCGNGYMSSWKANKAGMAGSALRTAGNILGGVLGRASYGSYEIQEAIGGPAHDHALQEAVAEIKPIFIQCKRCGQWVCRDICWNSDRALCKACAPILQRELAAKQAQITVEQAEEKLQEQDLTKDVDLSAKAAAACPACGAASDGGKFCSECGARLVPDDACPSCKKKIKPGSKFCPECGKKL